MKSTRSAEKEACHTPIKNEQRSKPAQDQPEARREGSLPEAGQKRREGSLPQAKEKRRRLEHTRSPADQKQNEVP